jgi:hypothetical protein
MKKSKNITFTSVKKKFFALSKKEQESVLKDAYNFSADTKKFWQGRFSDRENTGEEFLEKIEKIHIKSHKIGNDVDLKALRLVVNNAKKSYVTGWGMLEIYKLAYRGILDWANDYGYFPDNLENASSGYLEKYLQLIKSFISEKSEQDDRIFEEKKWIETRYNNIPTDYISHVFFDETGISLDCDW